MRGNVVAVGFSIIALVIAGCAASGGSGSDPTAPPTETPAQASSACADSSAAPDVVVRIRNSAFGPPSAEIKVGQSVGWSNQDGAAHTATLDDFDCGTGTLAGEGGAGTLVFAEPGEYAYHCSIHSSMEGTITVSN